jgi:hypothetical protein
MCQILIPNKTDLELRTVALKSRRDGRVVVKEVTRCSVDTKSLWIKDLGFAMMAGYVVDWSPEGLGRSHQWSYEGKWGREDYCLTRNNWKLNRHLLNPEAILEHPRFKYCAYTDSCGDVMDYLKRYVANPKLELVTKLGLGRLSRCDRFMKRLGTNKALVNFLIKRKDQINETVCSVDVLEFAFKHNLALAEAHRKVENRRELRRCGLPTGVSPERARAYIDRQGVTVLEYVTYLNNCVALGMPLIDTKVCCPKCLKARAVVIADKVAERERRKNRALNMKQDKSIRALVKRFEQVQTFSENGLCIVLPKSTHDLVVEGKRLANCLGDGHYAGKMARGEALIAFVRYQNAAVHSYVAAEIDLKTKRILQCYAEKNQKPPDMVEQFVTKAFALHAFPNQLPALIANHAA